MRTRPIAVLIMVGLILAAGGTAHALSCPPDFLPECQLGSSSSSYTLMAANWGSSGGTGFRGYGLSGTGVHGESWSTAASGVRGTNFTGGGYGVLGQSSGNGVAVMGDNPNLASWAGYFTGNVGVRGYLYKYGGGFRIDHPLDPANAYLYHSFVESPDMKNIYDGNITTDANGEATVVLPAYFEALNQDYRYQLTVIGQFAQAIVASQVKDNRFTIKTDKPSVQVSWQVTGIRHDPYAAQNRIQTEVEKQATERGTYLYPEGYGQPETKGQDYQRLQQLRSAAPDEQLTAPPNASSR